MKKLILILFLLTTLISCGVSKTVQQSKKTIKGDWLVESITYSETGTFNVNLLNDVSSTCFEGSSWNFIPNNNTGSYTIAKDQCTEGQRYFVFTIKEIDPETGLYDFLLKPTNEKNKSEDNHGFRLQLTHLSDSSMSWEQIVSLDNKPFKIYMNFSKIVE